MRRRDGGRGLVALRLAMGIFFVTAAAAPAYAQNATLEQRVAGADRVVVATVRNVAPEWRENKFGDRLIVSRIQLEVSETLKGDQASTVWMEMEGGTLDGFTLQVSTLPRLSTGERGVFMLDAAERGVHTPHLRGYGILPLDDHDVIRGTSLRLDEVRNRVRGSGR
jgi:hypothetical protein